MYPASAIDVSTAQHHVSKNRGWGFQNFSLANYGNRIHNYRWYSYPWDPRFGTWPNQCPTNLVGYCFVTYGFMGEKDGVKKVCYSMIGIEIDLAGLQYIYIYITISKSMVPSCKLTNVYIYIRNPMKTHHL